MPKINQGKLGQTKIKIFGGKKVEISIIPSPILSCVTNLRP